MRGSPDRAPDSAHAADGGGAAEGLPLEAAIGHVLEECRMVLPGIQALFGFQLIAVFDGDFAARLTAGEQQLHLAAITLVVSAIGLVMAPAAIHRHIPLRRLDERFVRLASRLLAAGMAPLAFATCLEVYLVAILVLRDKALAAGIALALFAMLAGMWLVLPLRERQRRRAPR